MSNRNGKIARLPRDVRDELNKRIDNGEPANRLVAWLNDLPEVKRALATYFEGREINEPNLSEWSNGGYLDWRARKEAVEEARERAANADELAEAAEDRPAHHLATVLTDRYAAALEKWDGEMTEAFERKLKGLGRLCQDITRLRRGEQNGIRVRLAEDRARWDEHERLEKREAQRKDKE